MAKAVFGCKKLRSWGEVGGCSHHLRRSIPTPNADPARLDENIWLIGGPDIENRVRSMIDSHGIKPRSNAVLAEEVLLSVGPDFFRPDDPERAGTWTPDRLAAFKKEAISFLKRNFGDRVAAAVLHLDESTPHIQAVIVPIHERKDGTWGLNAKEMFSPVTIRKLRKDYQKPFVDKYGVEPADEFAKMEHVPMQKIYGTAARLDKSVPEVFISSRPPVRRNLQSYDSHNKELDEWMNNENAKINEKLTELKKTALQGQILAMATRGQSEAMMHISMGYEDIYSENKKLLEENSKMIEKLTKEDIASLRKINVSKVAERLGHFGEILRGENAIDLVRRVNEFSYLEALAWLNHEFGAHNASSMAAEYIERHLMVNPPDRPLTKSQKAKKIVVDQQLSALDCDKYRITVMWVNEKGKKVGWNLGKDRNTGEETLFSKQDIINKIPDLEVYNHDKNIFITPKDDDFHYILIDDLDDEGNKLKEMGMSPCLIQKTSDNSVQAVVKVPKNRVEKDKANEFFKAINKAIGDKKITGLEHPFRLAGFRNVKTKHRRDDDLYPLVRILEARRTLCERTISSIMTDDPANHDFVNETPLKRP